jgi:hypothetical protein
MQLLSHEKYLEQQSSNEAKSYIWEVEEMLSIIVKNDNDQKGTHVDDSLYIQSLEAFFMYGGACPSLMQVFVFPQSG